MSNFFRTFLRWTETCNGVARYILVILIEGKVFQVGQRLTRSE